HSRGVLKAPNGILLIADGCTMGAGSRDVEGVRDDEGSTDQRPGEVAVPAVAGIGPSRRDHVRADRSGMGRMADAKAKRGTACRCVGAAAVASHARDLGGVL